MPLLAAEPNLYPESLFDEFNEVDEPWWVMYTLSRQEKSLCRHLQAARVPHYCPIIERRYRSPGGRARVTHLPLFANYVFVRGSETTRYQTVSTGCVSRCLSVSEPAALVSDLRRLHHLIGLGAPLTPEARLEPGMRVQVKNGPFEGVQGVVIKRHSETRLLVMVNFIQRGASIEIGDYELEQLV